VVDCASTEKLHDDDDGDDNHDDEDSDDDDGDDNHDDEDSDDVSYTIVGEKLVYPEK